MDGDGCIIHDVVRGLIGSLFVLFILLVENTHYFLNVRTRNLFNQRKTGLLHFGKVFVA